MSDKFVVGQWVRHFDGTVKKWDDTRSYGEGREWDWKPFVWQVGKTYKTTIGDVTVRIVEIDSDGDVVGMPWEGNDYRHWRGRTGRLIGHDSDETKPHLIPYFADEPPPVADAATFSEFEDGGECDKDLNALESMLDEFVAERMACEAELRTSRDLVSRWESRIDAWQHAEKIAREKIERAKR